MRAIAANAIQKQLNENMAVLIDETYILNAQLAQPARHSLIGRRDSSHTSLGSIVVHTLN